MLYKELIETLSEEELNAQILEQVNNFVALKEEFERRELVPTDETIETMEKIFENLD